LPDGTLSNQKFQFGSILEGPAMEDVGITCGHLLFYMAICYFIWPFVILYGHLVYFMAIWYIFPLLVCCVKKNLATLQL
jgi:hypothetical protein